MIHFARVVLGEPLDPWQQWLVIHLGELLEDGRPRFRQALVIVARQNGKTHVCKVLALFWLFVEKHSLVFGTSTDLEQAKEAWEAAVTAAEECPELADRMPPAPRHKKIGNGQQVLHTRHRSRYRIGASNSKGGRGKTIPRQIGDELREQRTWDAYNAAYNAMNACRNAQVVYITNMGDARSVVLNSLRGDALADLAAGETDVNLGLFEWSAPKGTHPTDPAGHAAANPQYGRRMDPDPIIKAARRVSKPGADPIELAGFQTEVLCMSVSLLEPAYSPASWARSNRPGTLPLEERQRIAACVDVAPGGGHVTLAAAAVMDDERVRVEAVHEWSGPDALVRMSLELPAWVRLIRPKTLGWFPSGPAAAVDAELRDRTKTGRVGWPPRGVKIEEIKADAAAVIMGFGALLDADRVSHSGQDFLDAQVDSAEKLWTGDRWVITRRAGGHVDGVYAIAGAAHLARTLPRPRKVASGVFTSG